MNEAMGSIVTVLIAGIITEKGICRPPYSESLRKLFEE